MATSCDTCREPYVRSVLRRQRDATRTVLANATSCRSSTRRRSRGQHPARRSIRAAMGNGSGRGVPPALLSVLERPGPLVILPHDNPDPDALASAATLRYIAKALAGKDARDRARRLRRPGREPRHGALPQHPAGAGRRPAAGRDRDTIIALVDTQPGRPNNSLPAGVAGRRSSSTITRSTCRSPGVPFADMRDGYGATSTILTEYLMDTRLRPETKIATALFYGIMAETQDLGREASRSGHGGDALPLPAHEQAPPGEDRERARAARVLRRLPRRRSSRR